MKPEMTSSTALHIDSRRVFPLILLALLVVSSVWLLPRMVAAQESSKDEVHYTGAHDIRVVPVNFNLAAGSAQFSVYVTDPRTGEGVTDADVVMLAESAEEGDPGWAFATNTPAAPERYDVHLKLDSTGEWRIQVDVSSSLGSDLADVTTLEVPSLNRLTQGSWVFFGMFGIIVLGIAYVWWTARRDYRRKQATARADSQ